MDIATLDRTTLDCPQIIYDAIQQALKTGSLLEDLLRTAPIYEGNFNPFPIGGMEHYASTFTIYLPHAGDPAGWMAKWYVPANNHRGRTRLLAYGPC